MTLSSAQAFVRLHSRAIWAAIGLLLLAWTVIGFLRFTGGLKGYCNVTLDDDRQEVLYRLGYPPVVLAEPEKGDHGFWQRVYYTDKSADPKNAIPIGKTIHDFSEWSFRRGYQGSTDASINVTFDRPTNRVESISCMELGETQAHLCPTLIGINIGDTEEQIVEQLGKPDRFQRDGVSKTIRYDDLGVEFVLTKTRVYILTLLNKRADRHVIFLRYLRTYLP